MWFKINISRYVSLFEIILRKLIPPITLLPCKKKIEPEKDKDSTSVSDKFNIVLEVATKGQVGKLCIYGYQ